MKELLIFISACLLIGWVMNIEDKESVVKKYKNSCSKCLLQGQLRYKMAVLRFFDYKKIPIDIDNIDSIYNKTFKEIPTACK